MKRRTSRVWHFGPCLRVAKREVGKALADWVPVLELPIESAPVTIPGIKDATIKFGTSGGAVADLTDYILSMSMTKAPNIDTLFLDDPLSAPPKKERTREQEMRHLRKKLVALSEQIADKELERDAAVSYCGGSLSEAEWVRRKYEAQLDALYRQGRKWEAKFAQLRDSDPCTPDEGAARDGTAMRLVMEALEGGK